MCSHCISTSQAQGALPFIRFGMHLENPNQTVGFSCQLKSTYQIYVLLFIPSSCLCRDHVDLKLDGQLRCKLLHGVCRCEHVGEIVSGGGGGNRAC